MRYVIFEAALGIKKTLLSQMRFFRFTIREQREKVGDRRKRWERGGKMAATGDKERDRGNGGTRWKSKEKFKHETTDGARCIKMS